MDESLTPGWYLDGCPSWMKRRLLHDWTARVVSSVDSAGYYLGSGCIGGNTCCAQQDLECVK